MSNTNTPETFPLTDAAEAETKPGTKPETAKKGAGAILAEVQGKTNPKANGKGKGGKGKGGKGKKPAKPAKPEAEEPAEETPLPVTINFLKLPKPVEKMVARKDITKDKRLQHRDKMQDTSEGGAVDQYAAIARDAKKAGEPWPFPPVIIVEDISDTPDKGTNWLVDGFQREGAATLNHMPEIPALVYRGTFADALLLSLSSNGENSVIPRTKGDAQRAIAAALDNPEVCEAILSQAKGNGGVHRVFAAACKTSTGTVDWALKARGKKPKGNTLVNFTPKKAPPTKTDARPDPSLVMTGPVTTPEVTEKEQAKEDARAFEVAKQLERPRLIAEAVKASKKLSAVLAILIMDDDKGTEVRKAMREHDMPLGAGFDKEAAKEGKNFAPHYAILEHWGTAHNLVSMFEKIETIFTPEPLETEAAK